jgi:hypothetical protein
MVGTMELVVTFSSWMSDKIFSGSNLPEGKMTLVPPTQKVIRVAQTLLEWHMGITASITRSDISISGRLAVRTKTFLTMSWVPRIEFMAPLGKPVVPEVYPK